MRDREKERQREGDIKRESEGERGWVDSMEREGGERAIGGEKR